MARKLFSFTNTVGWRLDRQSWNRVKKESERLGKQFGKIHRPDSPPDAPRGPRQTRRRLDDNDAHIKQYRKLNAEQEKFVDLQEKVISRFLISNRQIREMTESERKAYVEQLKQARNKKELIFLERKLKADIADNTRNEKLRTRELNKQNLAQKRLTASTEQMVGALASVYTGAAAVGAVIQTGMEFEKFNKTFLAVSDGAEEAADHIAFVREQAHRMGTDVIESGLSYSRMLAAVGNKVPLEEVREAFLAIGESATVLGLSQDDTAGAMRAMTQAMGKQKFQAEELRQQMGDRLPVAITAMELAAKDAGLAVDEVGLDKLMEQGKLTMDLLPFFSARLREFANNNDAFAKAARENYAPALTRMNNTFKDLKDNVFIGLKPALVAMMNAFSEVGEESKDLARTVGSTLGSAFLGLTFPIAITVASLLDLVDIFKELTGVSDESFNEMVRWGFGALGFTIGIIGMYKAIMKLVKGFKLLKDTGQAVKDTLSKTGETASKVAKDTSKFKYQGSWDKIQKTGSTGITGRIGSALGKLSGPLAAITGAMSLGERLSSTEERNQNIVDYITKGQRNFEYGKPQERDISIKIGIDGNGNINPYIDKKLSEHDENRLIEFYQNLSPSN
jgi:tape measure domain-containing protein